MCIRDRSCAGIKQVTTKHADLPITQARAVVTALGGRFTGETPEHVAILLPRR